MNYWLIIGSPENWEEAFQKGNIWGFSERQSHTWNKLKEGDVILFYAKEPIRGVLGYGIVKTKFRQTQPLWSAEIKENRVRWPLRFEFDVEYVLPRDRWEKECISSDISKFKAGTWRYELEEAWAREIIGRFKAASGPTEEEEPSHQEIKEKLVEIGRMQNYIAEEEYPFDLGRLDVVWRRVPQSVPTYVFEVNVRGDLYRALSKLKHAYDLWGSRIFIVASATEAEKIQSLLAGAFHEMNNQLKFIDLDKVRELHRSKKYFKTLEQELGL